MNRRLTVYNHFGIGDLFESREFVLEWMRQLNVEDVEYACRYPAVFEDLPQIKTREVTPDLPLRGSISRKNGHYILNSWIGALNAETQPRGDYVLWPGVGCTVEHIHRMHHDYMKRAGLRGLTKPPQDFLTMIDYSRINTGKVDEFRERIRWRFVLVCNGKTGSGHAANFSMAEMVGLMPVQSSVSYLLTERAELNRPDVFFTDDITERGDRCDVLAISYLSTFCDVIVGRCSGAQMVCETKENWMNESKTLLSFTEHDNGATFVRNPEALGLKMRRVWSGANDPVSAATVLRDILK